jgi:hypothetical protein
MSKYTPRVQNARRVSSIRGHLTSIETNLQEIAATLTPESHLEIIMKLYLFNELIKQIKQDVLPEIERNF